MLEVHVNFAGANEAESIARDAGVQRLAAGANIHSSIRAFYWWNDAVQSEGEVPVVFQTSGASGDTLMAFIANRHSYETPGIVVHRPDKAHAPYMAWVERETRESAP